MPIELVDEAGNEIDLDKADGGTLRKKLEEALSSNKDLEQRLVTREAQSVIAEKGFSLVKPEDLEGVAPDQVEAKAKELHEQKAAERAETVRSVFEEKGLEGDDLDQAVEEFLTGEGVTPSGEEDVDVDPDFAKLPSVGGQRPSNKKKAPPMEDPMGNMVGHFEEQEKSSSGRK